jgi:hypothetical protein
LATTRSAAGGSNLTVPWIAAIGVFLIHLVGNPHYGFFRDELYFIICGRHPQWGYVDQPPLVPLLAAATQVFGHSLVLLRTIPALFAAAGVYTTCLLVTEFGGGIFAQALASIVFLLTPVLMSFGMKVSPDTVGLWTWPLIALLVARISKGAEPRLWIAAGLVTGLTLESKYSILFFLAALVVGIVLTPARRMLFNRWCLAGFALAVLIALPNFLWQWQNGFPMLELLINGQNGKNLVVGPLLYLGQELIITGLFLGLPWVIGLVWLLSSSQFRFLGFAYIILIAEMLAFHGKHYYPADVYPILIVAGAVPIERWTMQSRLGRAAALVYAIGLGLPFVPFAMPILSEETFVAYETRVGEILHISRSATETEHNREASTLPSDWADMHGWPELAAAVRQVYYSLPPAERAKAVVLGDNYGGASAVAFFAPDVPVISIHNQYRLWGTRGYTGDPLIQIGGSCWKSDHLYASRTTVTVFNSRWAIDYEQNLPIAICRGIRKPLAQEWAQSKAYI